MNSKLRHLSFLLLWLCSITSITAKDFIVSSRTQLKVFVPRVERPVTQTALTMFCEDAHRVLSCEVKTVKAQKKADIILTVDSTLPREGFRITVTDGKLHIAGADEHGLAYGLLEISRKMGVSPWEYWADCTPRKLNEFILKEGLDEQQGPAVAYRGIFINDEDWGLNPWATQQEPEAWTVRKGHIKGAIGPKVNERIFQLMLRLRANYYWPAMHECSQPFFTIEGNREVAARYGIYIGGSHCEPMATSPAAEWEISGDGDYNYVTNSESVRRFWQKRLDDVKDQEIVYTLGMRGVHDGSMQGVKTADEKVRYLQKVIDDQRQMLAGTHPRGTDVPQVFVPYKEVLDIYRSGLQVPDDVTLMWTDDNYGYIRHFPDSAERCRKGGNGVYYHVSYWGRPHDYLWLNSLSPKLLEQEMSAAYGRGIRQMWILNVGDIKPSEYQIELFMQLAWDGKPYETGDKGQVGFTANIPTMRRIPFLEHFVGREFGTEHQKEIMDVMCTYFRLSEEMKPEHMAGTRVEESDKSYWSKIHPILGDWTKARVAERVKDYQTISDKVEELSQHMPADRRDAFFQLVKYPVQAAAQMNFKFLCPDRCEEAYDSIQSLTYIYNKVCAGGKWDGIMDASPRRLPVFQKVTADMLPQYPDSSLWEALHRETDHVLFDVDNPHVFTTPLGTDSVTLRVHLKPIHPRKGNRLAFRLSVDGVPTPDVEYQTYDRSEEWKQNVIRGYAVRDIRVAVDSTKSKHQITFVPTTFGAALHDKPCIFIKKT